MPCSNTISFILAAILAAWGAQAIAIENPTDHAHEPADSAGGAMEMHMEQIDHGTAAHDAMSHGSDMHAPMSNMHAHHLQMMQRQGYERSVHDYAAPALSLMEMDGRETTLGELLDTQEPVMMNFIFTTCTTICPVLTATFSQVQQKLGAEAGMVRMISITIDPEEDTPKQLQSYAEKYAAGSQWHFLTGERENIIAVQKAFDIYRGSKTNHEPITLLRGGGAEDWVRIDGIASASDIIKEYRALNMAAK